MSSVNSCGKDGCHGYCWAYDNEHNGNNDGGDLYTDSTANKIKVIFCKCCGAGYGVDGSGIIKHPDNNPTCTGGPGKRGSVGIVLITKHS